LGEEQSGWALSVEVIDSIPLKLDAVELAANIKPETLAGKLEKLLQRAHPLIEAKAAYATTRVSKFEDDLVYLENGHALRGVVLADMLQSDQEVFPYVVTIGPKLEAEIGNEKNLLGSFLLDEIGNYALHKASVYLRSFAAEALGNGPGVISEFSPGTGTGDLFGLDQQKPLFEMLSPSTSSIGVHLSPSLMMVPRKSESGVFALTHEEYVACAYCSKRCESRSTPFVGGYRRSKRT
jgi:hypothetical protein